MYIRFIDLYYICTYVYKYVYYIHTEVMCRSRYIYLMHSMLIY